MSLILEKTVKATWECDWCDVKVITDSEHMPQGWEEANEPCGGGHFCSENHYYLSRCAWEKSFETGLEAQEQERAAASGDLEAEMTKKEFWEAVAEAAAEVATWPERKKAGVIAHVVAVGEILPPQHRDLVIERDHHDLAVVSRGG